jgi:tetratricopeptide (TPR) repeat protein
MQMIFSLRYQSQLRRTRPSLIQGLEKNIFSTVESYGGLVRAEPKHISAVFSGKPIGFALDMLSMLESIKEFLDGASSELYGHACIFGMEIPEEHIPALVHSLSSQRKDGTGIWCAPDLQEVFEPFIDFEKSIAGDIGGCYAQIKTIRGADTEKKETKDSEKIYRYLNRGDKGNAVIVGTGQTGEREGLMRYCREKAQDFPPLELCFYPKENAVTAMADSLTPGLRNIMEKHDKYPELVKLGDILFKERLRDELPDFIVSQGRQFFSLLLLVYRQTAERKKRKPVIVLENMQNADPLAVQIIKETYFSHSAHDRIAVYGTATELNALKDCKELFPRIVKFTPEEIEEPFIPVLPLPVWEIGYLCALFCKFFPVFLLPQLLREEGKNPVMIEKSLGLLSSIDLRDPRFTKKAEEVLKDMAQDVRAVARSRLLAWAGEGRIKPCYNFLEALAGLGGTENANLVLEALSIDMLNETCGGIEKAIQNKTFAKTVGKDWEKTLSDIVKIQMALNNEQEIRKIIGQDSSIIESLGKSAAAIPPAFEVRLYAIAASCYLGLSNSAAASEVVKKAMLLAQDKNQGRGLARIYRLFSLVEFTSHRLSEAIDYFGFAMDQADSTGDRSELAISAYYAATTHFIFGNISKAQRLLTQAKETAIASVLPNWADKCRFLEGRLCFEAGNYRQALDTFFDLQENPLGTETEEFRQTLAAWIFRTESYLSSGKREHLGGNDARLFEIEAAFLSGKYQNVVSLADKGAEESAPEKEFMLVEQPDWHSGFSQCELFLFPLKEFQNRMIHTYRAMALSRLPVTPGNERDLAIQKLQRIMRNEIPELDPNDAFYFYGYYRILKDTQAPEVDMNTAISMAFKKLQKRASRIDDNETKRSFLSQHRWNGALSTAAKEHKLI